VLAHREGVIKNSWSAPERAIATESFSNPNIEHEVEHNLRFLRWCGAQEAFDTRLELWLTQDDRNYVDRWLTAHLPRRAPLIVVHPSGGRSRLKQWPIENYRDLIARLLSRTQCDVLVIGGEDETWINREIALEPNERVQIVIGEFTLRQLGAILEQAALFVGGDTGPMHVAAAAGTRVVAVFGPTSETRFRPLGANARVASLRHKCSPDVTGTYQDRCPTCLFPEPLCLTELPVDEVVQQALASLTGAPTSTAMA
jgi:ADP-heptose:LPS heptosyltransferase